MSTLYAKTAQEKVVFNRAAKQGVYYLSSTNIAQVFFLAKRY
jgi:hypothetical protein